MTRNLTLEEVERRRAREDLKARIALRVLLTLWSAFCVVAGMLAAYVYVKGLV